MNPTTLKQAALVAVRTVTFLALGLWIGGMAFFGAMAAPVMFRVAREAARPELAPLMVGHMLTRFSFLALVCSVLIAAGWALDGLLTRPRKAAAIWWLGQGGATGICIVLGLFLGMVRLPAITRQQDAMLPIFVRSENGAALTSDEIKLKGEFDRAHKGYQQTAVINLWVAIAALVCLTGRASVASSKAAPHQE